MSDSASSPPTTPPRLVPTLTEVVDWPDGARLPAPDAPRLPLPITALATAALTAGLSVTTDVNVRPVLSAPAEPSGALPTEAQLVEHVLGEVQRQIDLMLEYRLREALMPVLARATENLIREARGELASTLRDIVARAVAQEIARHRPR